jgi:hypothetical protein
MKTVKFKQLPIHDIEGNEQPQDFAKLIGNVLFNQADDVAEHDLGVKIYHEGDIGTDINDAEEKILRKFLPMFKYVLRSAIERALSEK